MAVGCVALKATVLWEPLTTRRGDGELSSLKIILDGLWSRLRQRQIFIGGISEPQDTGTTAAAIGLVAEARSATDVLAARHRLADAPVHCN